MACGLRDQEMDRGPELFMRDKVAVIKIFRLHSPALYPIDASISESAAPYLKRNKSSRTRDKKGWERGGLSGLREAENLSGDNKDER